MNLNDYNNHVEALKRKEREERGQRLNNTPKSRDSKIEKVESTDENKNRPVRIDARATTLEYSRAHVTRDYNSVQEPASYTVVDNQVRTTHSDPTSYADEEYYTYS